MPTVNEPYLLNNATLLDIEGTALFYPCSGEDISVPIQLFSPFVTEFWFVDKGYFSPGDQDTHCYGYDISADKQKPVLSENYAYKLIDTTIVGPPKWDKKYRDIEPCILTETYTHIPSKKQIKIRRRRGYGFSAFRTEIDSIGIFFYRGDSQGEGGSGNLWLQRDHLREICYKLKDGGLIVTDGSQCTTYKPDIFEGYLQMARYNWKYDKCPKSIDESIKLVNSMETFVENNRIFTCVGYAGCRYGPTLVWQVRHCT